MVNPSGAEAVRDPRAREGLYPIRTVSSLTGVNAITLRAWERRYGLVKPQRTAKGHRLYTRADIDFINRVVAVLDKGVPVSQVREILGETGLPPQAAAREAQDAWQRYREEMVAAITRFDESRLEDIYNEALSLYPIDIVTRRLLLSLLRDLGERWVSAEGSVAEEHFFAVYLRNKLGARFHHRSRGNTGHKLLGACLPGERHEIGLLMFALAAHDRGYRLTLLGADMPLADLPLAARRSRSEAIVLSGSVEPDERVLNVELPTLLAGVDVPVFVGGLTSARRRDVFTQMGAVPVGEDLHQGLRLIDQTLAKVGESRSSGGTKERRP